MILGTVCAAGCGTVTVGPAFKVPPVPPARGARLGQPLSKRAFITHANMVCRRVNAAVTALPQTKTPAVAANVARQEFVLAEAQVADLAQLTPPARIATSYTRMLGDVRREIALIITTAQRAHAGLRPSAHTLDRQLHGLNQRVSRAARSLGLGTCAQDAKPHGAPSASITGSNTPRSQAITGDWEATGRVIQTHNSANETPGAALSRRWEISETCQAGPCQLQLARTVEASVNGQPVAALLVAVLHHSHGEWTATFSEAPAPCQSSTGVQAGIEDSAWTIRSTATGLQAIEQTRTSGPACITGSTEIAWSAGRPQAGTRIS